MKPKQISTLLLLTLALSLSAADSTNRLRFAAAGFSIASLELSPGEDNVQALMMFLPAHGGFAGNVNVQIQPYSGTIEEYASLSRKQFDDSGLKVIAQKKVGTSAAVFEYSGEMQGQLLHFYARAEKAGGHVYLATATATEQDWPKQAAQLKNCVESLRCERGEAGAAPSSVKTGSRP